MSNFTTEIEAYQAAGLKVIPLVGKSPKAKGWPNRDFAIDDFDGCDAVGVQMGPMSGIIDFEYDSDTQREALGDLFGNYRHLLNTCPCFQTKHGRHYWFAWDDRLNTTNAGNLNIPCDNGEKLIIRLGACGKGSQSAVPPSPNKAWLVGRSVFDIEAPPLPDEVIERLLVFKRRPDTPVTDDPDIEATPERAEACREALARLPNAVDGCGGHDVLMNAACEIRRHRIYGQQGRDLLDWFNENKCYPQFTTAELDHKNKDARKKEPSAEAEFDVIDDTPATIKFPNRSEEVTYRRITSHELATGDYRIDFAIGDTMVEGQPLIIAGPQKTLKTSTMIDAAVSLASGGYFFGKLKVKRPYRVTVMSGESGLATLQETAMRVCKAANVDLSKLSNLNWSPDLPKFGNSRHITAIEKFMQDLQTEILVVDPAYLSMSGADAGNLFIQGEMLREISLVCEQLGVTLVLLHHTKKINDRGSNNQPLSLTDIAWSGFQEFARQWWLLNRREQYVEGSGEHRLWLSVGGSAGHSALWGVDIVEGVRSEFSERTWDVNLFASGMARDQDQDRKVNSALTQDCEAIVALLREVGEPLVKSKIRDRTSGNTTRNDRAIESLVASGRIVPATAKAGNNQTYPGFTLAEDTDCD